MGRSVEIDGVSHGSNPIPMGARVGPLVCSSGLMGADPATGRVAEDGHEQVRLVFANLVTFLANAGASLADVVRVGVLLQDPDLRADINERWLALFPDAVDRPARHTTVRDLPGQMVVQLEVIAYIADR
jgi:2-iminobutanoate/2-iminopropanoate deaminase